MKVGINSIEKERKERINKLLDDGSLVSLSQGMLLITDWLEKQKRNAQTRAKL